MADFISRDYALHNIECGPWDTETDRNRAIHYVRELTPAADVRPVVKATWKRIDYKPCGHDYKCSSCGWKNDMKTRFCHNCGADMREPNLDTTKRDNHD